MPCFRGESVWTDGAESLSKVVRETSIGPWMALPNAVRNIKLLKIKESACKDLCDCWDLGARSEIKGPDR